MCIPDLLSTYLEYKIKQTIFKEKMDIFDKPLKQFYIKYIITEMMQNNPVKKTQ